MRWQETVPSDPYLILVRRPISGAEMGYLIHLYQPLIGVMPIALYQTLFQNLSLASFSPVQGSHYGLMVTLAAPLDVIVKARQQLEAIGLLEAYEIKADGERVFEYVLQPPYAPDVFFRDDTLSMMLLNRVGKEFYRKLRRRFALADEHQLPGASERRRITKAFDEVFYHLSPSEITVEKGTETHQFLQATEEESPLPSFNAKENSSRNYADRLDFEFLEAALPKMIKRKRLFTNEAKAELDTLAFTYNIDDETMSRLLQEPSVIPEDAIDFNALRRRIKEWYGEERGRMPKIALREEIVFQSDTEASVQQEQLLSEAENHTRLLASLSPLQLMEYYQHGGKIAPADQKIVEELLERYQLPSGVVNVLLEYVMFAYDRQLPKDIIYKIAAHWKRHNIQTVQEAKRQARQFHVERKKGNALFFDKKTPTKEKKSTASGVSGGRSKRKDEIPPLILEQLERQRKLQEKKETQLEKQGEQDVSNPEYEKKQQRVKALLKAMGESKQ